DLPKIVFLLADDPLGATRERFENPLPVSYRKAFDLIDQDNNNELLVLENERDGVVGVLQITYIPYLTYQGSWRALIEGVRIDKSHRAGGLGSMLVLEAIERAKQKNCRLVQLTSDKARPEAIQFYEKLGFTASHEGLKLKLA
ncbi:MAG: GNAT family N-acetyltransferase, partial [Deltaproteobacteria bacterium]